MASIRQKVYKHSEYFGNIFNHMRSNEECCDFIIKTEDGENIKVHKAVLKAVSPHFAALFNADMREKKESVVTFPDIDSGILRQIIDYIYTSEITINDDNAQLLLAASHILQIQWIVDQCGDYLKETLNITNCLTTHSHSRNVLSGYCTDYMIQNFENLVADESFLTMSFEELKDVISSDDLFVQPEEIIYGAVINWVKSSVDDRKVHLTELMSHVRLPLIKYKDILQLFIQGLSMETDSEFKDLLTKSVGDQLYSKNEREPYKRNIKLTQQRKSKTPSQFILIAGATCQLYDSSWDDIPIPQMRKPRILPCTVATNKNFYVFGGILDSVYTGRGERFDPLLNKWTHMPDMPTSRYNFGAVALGHLIYASGGFVKIEGIHASTNRVEIYNTEILEWKEGPPMDFTGYTKSVEVNNAIYCVGDYKVCCFDPRTPKWIKFSNSYHSPIHIYCVVSDKTYIYCIGVSAVARIDVRNRKWECLDNMKTARHRYSAILKNDLIHVIGGAEYNPVEMYDIQKDKWTPLDNIEIDCVDADADILNIG